MVSVNVSIDDTLKYLQITKPESYVHDKDITSDVPPSFIYRNINISSMKCATPCDEHGYIVAHIIISNDKSRLIFATMLFRKNTYEDVDIHVDYLPEYIIVSQTFMSKDGEYREGLIRWDNIEIFRTLFEKSYDIANNITHSFIDDYGYEMGIESLDKVTFDSSIEFISFTALTFAIMHAMDRITRDAIESHVPKYITETISKLEPLMKKIDTTELSNIMRKVRNMMDISNKMDYPKEWERYSRIGVKFMPMSVFEYSYMYEGAMQKWREIVINETVSDMVINGICGGYSVLLNWTIVDGYAEGMYDNPEIKLRYGRSKKGKKVLDELKALRDGVSDVDGVPEESAEIADLKEYITDPMSYLYKTIILSGSSLMCLFEHVGAALESYPIFNRNWDNAGNIAPNKCMYDTEESCAYIVFSALYSLHSLHMVAGALHCDLHINNICIRSVHDMFLKDPEKITYHAFMTGEGKDNTYIFNAFYNVTIIDYSRSIIRSSGKVAERFKQLFGESYISVVERNQTKPMYRLLKRWFPSVIKPNEDKVKSMIISNFEYMFKLCTYLDFLGFAQSFSKFCDTYNKEKIKAPHESLKKCLVHIVKEITSIVATQLDNVTKGIVDETLQEAGIIIFSLIFGKFKYAGQKDIYAIWSINAIMKYSLKKYEEFPPMMKYMKGEGPYIPIQCGLGQTKDIIELINPALKRMQHNNNKAKLEQDLAEGYKGLQASSWA